MSLKFLTYLFLISVLISSAFSVEYVNPTPEDGSKMALDSITFDVFDEGVNINDCELTVNGNSYEMSYSGGHCTYTLSDLPINKTTYTFQVSYDSSLGSLPERSFTYFPTEATLNKVPFFGFGSVLSFFLLLIGGLLFFRR